ncbi:hypothetical protein [Micromonospora auratinigra]|uniref:Uncharacterized protein n=1 Tax=Micromonospora auratinigra TaxID=261654 RepID=A0A1A8ZAG4_9ACTN|nr:hypothetical protein [Micromonospora auratinigra]SBT40865.1 hypothetical protein GA0070611_1417 [Micromonospora auratinigra]
MISGLWQTIALGILGAFIAELLRITPALKKNRIPTGGEIAVSVIYTLLGGGAALLGWEEPQRAFTVAVLGAAFPLLFSSAVRATAPTGRTRRGNTRPTAELVDYAAGRF